MSGRACITPGVFLSRAASSILRASAVKAPAARLEPIPFNACAVNSTAARSPDCRMPTKAEEERGYRAQNAVDVASGLDHADGVPLALHEDMDRRGLIGRLHRDIVPYMKEHRHSDPVELIPWYKLTLKLNPNLERIYTLGAFFMSDSAQGPKEAIELLEAGVQANPWTFEIRAALGRLLHDCHVQLGIPPQEAYERAVDVLREAIEMGEREKATLESRKEHFDDYQKQLLRESYLFLAKSLTELGRYEEAIAVCEEGYEATKNNLLNVQKRVTTKRMNGETVDEKEAPQSPHRPEAFGAKKGDAAPLKGTSGRELEEGELPISAVLGIDAPEDTTPLADTELCRKLIADIRRYPYEALMKRLPRLEAPEQAVSAVLAELERQHFVERYRGGPGGDDEAESRTKHHLTPIGLYVDMGLYGLDFWRRMEEEASALREKGYEVALG